MKLMIKDSANGLYSKGITYKSHNGQIHVQWSSTKGKVWTDEKNLKAHLVKYAVNRSLPETWEVIEIKEHPTRPIADWVDTTMLVKILKAK